MLNRIKDAFASFSSSQPSPKPLAEHAKVIETILSEFGVDGDRVDLSDGFGWSIQRGSAFVFIGLRKHSMTGEDTIRVLSPILKLPSKNLLPFYRRCLEINEWLIGCALAVDDNGILVVSERQTLGIDKSEIIQMIVNTSTAADTLDNMLAEEFGAEMLGVD